MTAIECLHHLESLGLVVRLKPDGRLGVSPSELITDDVQAMIRKHREGIVEALLLAERAERIFGGVIASQMAAVTSSPQDDAPDLPELLTWWDRKKSTLPLPLKLAPGVTLTGTDKLDTWINDTLTGGARSRVAAQLRWIRKAAEQQ